MKKNAKNAKSMTAKKVAVLPKQKVQPLGDRVVIRELSEEEKERTTASGIIIPVTVNDDKGSKRGTVVAVGPGHIDDGKRIPLEVKPGDSVLFSWGEKIKVDGEEYTIVRESEIIAIINN